MSVIVKKDGKIVLYCKGADSKVKERLDSSEKEMMAQTDEHLNVGSIFPVINCKTRGVLFRNSLPMVYVHFVWHGKILTKENITNGQKN